MTKLSKTKRRVRARYMPRYFMFYEDALEPDTPVEDEPVEEVLVGPGLEFHEAEEDAHDLVVLPLLGGGVDDDDDDEEARRRRWVV